MESSGKSKLADFMGRTADSAQTNGADLVEVLEEESISEEERSEYLGVFIRMREIGLNKILQPALDILAADPDIADVISDGPSGGDLEWQVGEIYNPYSEFNAFAQLNNSPDAFVELINLLQPTAAGEAKTDPSAEAELVTTNGLVRFRGRINSQSNLLNMRINDQWAFIDETGAYDVTLPFRKGENNARLVVNDPSGLARKLDYRVISSQDGQFLPLPGRRVALMIGVEEYDNAIPELDTPIQDITDIGETLATRQQFEIERLENPTKMEVIDKLRQLSKELTEEDTLVVYYAGHGQLVEQTGRGYWLPRDAQPDSPENWISNRDIARLFYRTPTRQILMIADSCYSGAFIGRETTSIESAAPNYSLTPRAVMAMSSGGEEPVWDGGADGNSIFAGKLLETMAAGRVEGRSLYRQVRARVTEVAPQVPGYGAMLMPGYDDGSDFILNSLR